MTDALAEYTGNLQWLKERTILFVRHGSHAYGTNIATSDEDFKGVAIPPRQYFYGFQDVFEQAESKSPDMVVYDVRKFMRLAADCNPNLIEMLWTEPEDRLVVTSAGRRLIEARDMFLSRKAKHTFSGYAVAQLKRIKTHRAWLLKPPVKPPERKDFGLSEDTKVSASEMGAYLSLEASGKAADVPASVTTIMLAEKRYQAAKTQFEQYERWKRERNPARAAAEAVHGYDTKHALHLVRLLRMCREILTTSKVLVRRPDREDLLAIRAGEWSYDQLVEWAEREDAELEAVAESSPLPKAPDRKALDALCIELVEDALRA